jgi:MFS superfamily sulfate permease-like transporter
MALSLASNLAHAPPVNGLYSFVIHPFVYAILGSCPLLVIGPEAAGSLLTGAIVKACVLNKNSDDNGAENAIVIGISTAMSGAMIFLAGLTRLGFLDNVLSRPFLRGFITAIGFVIFVDQLIPELGLAEIAKDAGVSHGTSVSKLSFIVRHAGECHALTAIVSLVSFSVIMIFRFVKCILHVSFSSILTFF